MYQVGYNGSWKVVLMSKMQYMYKDRLVAEYVFDIAKNRVHVKQIGQELMDKPFGDAEVVSMSAFEDFLESRCFPRQRHGCKDLLAALELESYDPFSIVAITYGRQWDDYYWLRSEGDETSYDSIKLRP